MLKLYLDHNVQRQIASGLRLRQIDLLTAYEDGMHDVSDEKLLERASALGRVIVSKDSDFLAITSVFYGIGQSFSGVIYLTDERVSIGRYIDELELVAKVYEISEVENTIVYLPF